MELKDILSAAMQQKKEKSVVEDCKIINATIAFVVKLGKESAENINEQKKDESNVSYQPLVSDSPTAIDETILGVKNDTQPLSVAETLSCNNTFKSSLESTISTVTKSDFDTSNSKNALGRLGTAFSAANSSSMQLGIEFSQESFVKINYDPDRKSVV